jgi:hypothetical protein
MDELLLLTVTVQQFVAFSNTWQLLAAATTLSNEEPQHFEVLRLFVAG